MNQTAMNHRPRTLPCLPEGMQRSDVEGLLNDIGPSIGLKNGLLRALLGMIRETRPQDWVSTDAEPVCFAQQSGLASFLGMSARSLRRYENLFEKLGLLHKRVGGDGSRCRIQLGGGQQFTQGLVFTPLIELIPKLLEKRAAQQAERQERATLKRQISALRRYCRKLAEKITDATMLDRAEKQMKAWPMRYEAYSEVTELQEHLLEVQKLATELTDSHKMGPNMSAEAVTDVRPYIQDTNKDTSVECNVPIKKRTGETSSPDTQSKSVSNEPEIGLENKPVGSGSAVNSEFLSTLRPQKLYLLCSEHMKCHVDISKDRAGRGVPSISDFIAASIARLPELGINQSAYEDALSIMDDVAVMLCVLILDKNRDHPTTPVRNPGGVLRAMTARARSGQLNLVGSLIGLEQRLVDRK